VFTFFAGLAVLSFALRTAKHSHTPKETYVNQKEMERNNLCKEEE